jgi:hypothetical protein
MWWLAERKVSNANSEVWDWKKKQGYTNKSGKRKRCLKNLMLMSS